MIDNRIYNLRAQKILKCIESCSSTSHYSTLEKWLDDLHQRKSIDDFIFYFAYNRLYMKANGQ